MNGSNISAFIFLEERLSSEETFTLYGSTNRGVSSPSPMMFRMFENGRANIANSVVISNNGLTTFSNSVSVSTNIAKLTTASNPNNSYVTGTLYTNAPQRALLVGAVALASGVSGSANITLYYTNVAGGFLLPMQIGAGVAMTDYVPFCVPLDASATFKFVSTMGTGASGNITNVVLWKN